MAKDRCGDKRPDGMIGADIRRRRGLGQAANGRIPQATMGIICPRARRSADRRQAPRLIGGKEGTGCPRVWRQRLASERLFPVGRHFTE